MRSIFEAKLGEGTVHRFAFDVLSGDLRFSGGKVLSSGLIMDSKNLSLTAKGQADLVKETLDAKVSIEVLTFVDEILNRIPFMHLVKKQKKGIIPLWAGVEGGWKDPSVIIFKL